MPQHQNPERGSGDASPGTSERPRTNGHRTATPDAPHLPRQRHQVPSRPPANATPPGGQARTSRPTPPGGVPSSARPSSAARPPRMMPGPGTPEPVPPAPAAGRATSGGTGGGPEPDGRGTAAADGSGSATTLTKKEESDLNFNKVAAGAGAAVVTAVLGSFLGAVGTILGAALGSIITTFATTLFQRSIERTRTQVVDKTQKIRERRGAPGAVAWQNAARDGAPDSQATVRIDPSALGADQAPAEGRRRFRMSRKSILLSAAAAVLAFGLAMFLVTGIEWVKGSTITGGGSGTSIGNVVQGTPTQQQGDDGSGASTGSSSESTTSTSESDSERSGQSTSTSENGSGSDSPDSTSNPLQDGLDRIVPSQSPQSGQLQNGQNGGSNTGSGGANSTG